MITVEEQLLIFHGKCLNESETLASYGIYSGSTIDLVHLNRGGGCSGDLTGRGDRKQRYSDYLAPTNFTKDEIFHRNTNVTGYFDQATTPKCFAYAASCAYINTCKRIYAPAKPIPTFDECLEVADYSAANEGGWPEVSIERLEKKFGFGVQFQDKHLKVFSIRDILICSVIVTFSTSQEGWANVRNGGLLEKAPGEATGLHSTLIEGYNFRKDCCICKNSWGDEDGYKPRFLFRFRAAHDFYTTLVYYTNPSVEGKVLRSRPCNISRRFTADVEGQSISAAYMDAVTANDTSEFLCEERADYTAYNNRYIGYKAEEYISILIKKWRDYSSFVQFSV